MSGIEGVIGWLLDRRDNCIRLSKTKAGDDRKGWEEDAAYFHAAAKLIADAYPANQTPN